MRAREGIFSNLSATKVRLEQRRHLSIPRSGIFQNQEMDIEGKHVNDGRNNDQADDASDHMTCQFHLGHLEITEFVPQVFRSVETKQSGDEESHPFDATDTSNAQAGQNEPDEPFDGETLSLQSVESGPAGHGGEGKAEKHGIEEDESRDGGVRILTQYHEGD